jgi:hypothetical protein
MQRKDAISSWRIGVGKKLLRQAGTTDLIETLRITRSVFLFLVILRQGGKHEIMKVSGNIRLPPPEPGAVWSLMEQGCHESEYSLRVKKGLLERSECIRTDEGLNSLFVH